MKRVTPQPILPREMGENWRLEVLRLLREYSDAINQAADHRLSEFVSITGAYTAGEIDHVIVAHAVIGDYFREQCFFTVIVVAQFHCFLLLPGLAARPRFVFRSVYSSAYLLNSRQKRLRRTSALGAKCHYFCR